MKNLDLLFIVIMLITCQCQKPFDKLKSSETQLLGKRSKFRYNQTEKCILKAFEQQLLSVNCEPVLITNKFCFGSCNSIYIPQMKQNFKNCKACVPIKSKHKTIKLRCKINGKMSDVSRNISIIRRCACQEIECTKW